MIVNTLDTIVKIVNTQGVTKKSSPELLALSHNFLITKEKSKTSKTEKAERIIIEIINEKLSSNDPTTEKATSILDLGETFNNFVIEQTKQPLSFLAKIRLILRKLFFTDIN